MKPVHARAVGVCGLGVWSLVLLHHLYSPSYTSCTILSPGYRPLFQPRTIKSVRTEFLKAEHYRHAYSQLNSSQISELSGYYHRNVTLQWTNRFGLTPPSKPVPDARCLQYVTDSYNLSVSVVLCYRNELMSLLFRTIATLMRHTPTQYLTELILVDDGSDVDTQHEVEEFCEQLSAPCTIVRNTESMGIANARHYGIRHAQSDVVVILDSHMEVSEVWLEPLLHIIQSKPRAVAIPCVQLINEHEYEELHDLVREPYGVELSSGFGMIKFYYVDQAADKTLPYPTASVAGGALAARKSTLLDLYPVGIVGKSWGVENHRFALRGWMCGGGLWMSYCSQILHANGNDVMLHRYTKSDPRLFQHLRDEILAEILNFIDEESERDRMLLSVLTDANAIENAKNTSRKIREMFDYDGMGCERNYTWYLDHIHKTFHYDYFSTGKFETVGELQSVYRPAWCVANVRGKVRPEYGCRGNRTVFYDTHVVAFTTNNAVRWQQNTCWDEGGSGTTNGAAVSLYPCHTQSLTEHQHGNTQMFQYLAGSAQIEHVVSNRCLELEELGKQIFQLVLNLCNSSVVGQKWDINVPVWL